LSAATEITATPVVSMGAAPLAAGLKGAVRFAPAGLTFALPASLRVEGAAPLKPGLRAVGFSRSDDGQVMVVTSAGTNDTPEDAIYISTDGGATWAKKWEWDASGWYWYPLAMTGDASVIYAGCSVGKNGANFVIKSTDSGETWTDITPSPFYECRFLVTSSNGAIVWAAGFYSRTFRSTNGGTSWTEIRPTNQDLDGYSTGIAISSDGVHVYIIYAAGTLEYRLYYSDDSGDTFTELQPIDTNYHDWINLSCSDNGQHVYAAVLNGRLYYSGNYGSTWAEIQPFGDVNSSYLELKCSSDGSRVFVADGNNAGGALAYPRYSTDYGATWVDLTVNGTNLLYTSITTSSISADGLKILVSDSYNSQKVYLSSYEQQQ
jgi:photosystem II stability/assembly factor-like uncharacterized protein